MSAAVEQRVQCTMRDGVADVCLDRPDKINALDPAMFEQLVDTGLALRDDPEVRAVVLRGAGNGFCAGLDFAEFQRMAHDGADSASTAMASAQREPVGPAKVLAQQAVCVWAALPMPVISAVHGVAFGGGLQLTLGTDIRLTTPAARWSVMEINWGIIPDMTGTQLLPELVGRDVAKELTLTGREVSGGDAATLGLVTRACDDPGQQAHELATEIAGKNPHAVRHAKYLLERAGRVELTEGLAAEQDAIRALVGSPNQVEAVRANFDKRAARFDAPTP